LGLGNSRFFFFFFNRGDAASIVEIEGARATVIGKLEDRTPIAYTVYSGQDVMRAAPGENHVLVGAGDFGGWFVKAKLASKNAGGEDEYLLCSVEGFKYQYRRLTESQVRAEIKL